MAIETRKPIRNMIPGIGRSAGDGRRSSNDLQSLLPGPHSAVGALETCPKMGWERFKYILPRKLEHLASRSVPLRAEKAPQVSPPISGILAYDHVTI